MQARLDHGIQTIFFHPLLINFRSQLVPLDFRYYDDGADEHKEIEGTLLPLWDFSFQKTSAELAVPRPARRWVVLLGAVRVGGAHAIDETILARDGPIRVELVDGSLRG